MPTTSVRWSNHNWRINPQATRAWTAERSTGLSNATYGLVQLCGRCMLNWCFHTMQGQWKRAKFDGDIARFAENGTYLFTKGAEAKILSKSKSSCVFHFRKSEELSFTKLQWVRTRIKPWNFWINCCMSKLERLPQVFWYPNVRQLNFLKKKTGKNLLIFLIKCKDYIADLRERLSRDFL